MRFAHNVKPAMDLAPDVEIAPSPTVIPLRPRADNALARPLVVDLDGTLLRSDMLAESAFAWLKHAPQRAYAPLLWLLCDGKAGLKAKLAQGTSVDVTVLPYDETVLDWLRRERDHGRSLVLATATNEHYAQAIADHLGIFDRVIASDASSNLSSHAKRARLVAEYGERGFDYVGNSRDDIAVWKAAATAYVVNASSGVERRARQAGNVESVIDSHAPLLEACARALRLHQWLKNLLIFVPLLAAHRMSSGGAVLATLLAFLAFGLCASSVYLLNDLLDLEDDRHHPVKRKRPFASGALPIVWGVVLSPALLAASVAIACCALPWRFVAVLLGYYALTLAYSLFLKKQVMVDVVVLAALYSARMIAGAAAIGVHPTFWLLAFSMFVFLSLALAKRYTELHTMQARGVEKTRGRGYLSSDLSLISSLGTSSGYLAVLVLALYIQDARTAALYRSPQLIWLACPVLMYWISRMWIMAHRGQMDHDPIVFAARDRVSLFVAALFGVIFWAAC
jgi:4-hydroxybenzoate polyprenyltransferase/phosphoserine phosphatase